MVQVAVAIIKKNNSILACQRKKTASYSLLWEFPGGKIETNETLQQCLWRELKEELSIDAVVGEEIYSHTWVYPDAGKFEVHYFIVNSYIGTEKNNVFEQIRWITIDELDSVNFLEGNREVIQGQF